MQLKPGTLLQGGKYRILNAAEVLPKHKNVELGQGGFGITYLAEHTTLGKRVCIKEFFMKELNLRSEDGSITGLSEGTLSYNYARKFRKEAMNLARMEHPNIVRVTDSFDENGTFYYVMDYIEGQNLNGYIEDHILSESEAISIIKDVANALIYMHEKKHMLHLDLKPGNIMRRASDGHIFLIDFGLSKHYDKNGTPETSTTIGGGTPGYAPTEQGDKAKDGEFRPTIDVYALGATLFKLLTRETPPTASEVVNDDEILAEKLSNKGVSQNVIDLVVKAMKPGYKKRIQTMREFIAALPDADVSGGKADTDDERTFFENPNIEPNPKKDKKEGATTVKGVLPPQHRKISKKVYVILTAFAIFAIYFIASNQLSTTEYVQGENYHYDGGPETYTGSVKDGIPHGQGRGIYSHGIYEGSYKDGERHGEGVFEDAEGGRFTGTFANNDFEQGTYVQKDGTYYKGTFKDQQPYNGTWYEKDGNFIVNVVNGK